MSDNQMSKQEERRLIRQKRRKRSRMIAFIVMILFIAALGTGGFFGVSYLKNNVVLGGGNDEVVEAEITPETIEEEPIIDMTPEIDLEPVEEEVEPVEEITEPEPTAEELLEEMVETMVGEMTLEDKVAGLFIISPEALTGQSNVTKAGEGTKAALEEYAVGGIVYSKQNIKSADQLKEMIENTNSYSKYPLFIATEEEGGSVSPVGDGLKLEQTPAAKELGENANLVTAYDNYKSIGGYLSEYGFNLDFAPVADVLTNDKNTSIGNRAFGTETAIVVNMMDASVSGLRDAGIATCIKHFPGQGNADGDTHKTLATTERTKAEMDECELLPFKAGIEAGTDMIMVSHVAAPELTGDNTLCTLSKEVMTDLLRVEMEYRGVIITDAMNVPEVSEYYGADEAAIKAIKAGADMILMPEDFKLAYEGVLAAVQDGTIDEQRITDSLKRVYRVKYRETLISDEESSKYASDDSEAMSDDSESPEEE